LPLFNLQICLLRACFQKYTKQCWTMTLDLETVCKIYPRRWHLNGNSYSTPLYIWTNYSVSSWNVLIWLKYDFMHIFMHHLSLYFDI
jgi:hypothetical protein